MGRFLGLWRIQIYGAGGMLASFQAAAPNYDTARQLGREYADVRNLIVTRIKATSLKGEIYV